MEVFQMVTEKEVKAEDKWFEEYDKPREKSDYPQLPIFEMKLAPGKLTRTETVLFVSEGHTATTRFGETIVFTIRNNDQDKTWFVKKTQYSLLNPIAREKKKGAIAGREAVVERVGSGAKETKWNLTFK